MKKIALIRSASSAVSKSQYNIQEIGLANELVKMNMLVDVFLISDKDKTYSEHLGYDGRVTVYWLKGIKIPGQQGYYPDLKKILESNHYDLIQALDDSQLTTVWVSRYCKKHHIKFVLWQGMYENYPENYKRVIQYFFDWTLLRILRKNTKYCIAKTSSAKQYIENKRFAKTVVIPVALELSNFKDSLEIDYRKKFNIPSRYKVLLYVGKVEDRRKPLFCMEVYQKIKTDNSECCLVYVGRGPMLDETKEYVKNHKILDVYFIDYIQQNELPSLYAMSDLFILPTRYEIFGMVLMESMYFGTPVVTYKAAGPLDIIENGVDGIILENFDVSNWSNKIQEFLFKDLTKKMGNYGHKKISLNYIWPVIAHKYYTQYLEIINSSH